MDSFISMIQNFQEDPLVTSLVLGGVLLFVWILCGDFATSYGRRRTHLPPLPEVPGLPVIGNLLQLKEKKPHKTFTNWAATYGPIYSIRLGASTVVVLNSNEVAREAMVTRYSSISSRKLSNALQVLSSDKCLVAMSDYNEFHKMAKRCIMTNLLGANAQKRHRCHRDTLINNLTEKLRTDMKSSPSEAVGFRKTFESELFGVALKQALGRDVNSVYVEELGTTLSRENIFRALVSDMMAGAIEVDWRDFFPYLKWMPNRSFERKIQNLSFRRKAVTKALIRDHKKLIASGEKQDVNCYLNVLMSEASLSEDQVVNLLWETIIETSDTTLVTTEWALYELAKDKQKQDRLYREIEKACGSERITEDHLSQVPYLSAVFHETLRKHSPVPVVPLRYAHEDTELGGHFIPRGSEIAINIYGCNMDKKQWENPEQWIPERFMAEKYDPTDLYKTMAFGGGKRVCAGSLQAMVVSCGAIGRLVQEFEWQLKDGEEENVATVGLTTHKLHPIQAILKPRKQY